MIALLIFFDHVHNINLVIHLKTFSLHNHNSEPSFQQQQQHRPSLFN